MSLMDSIRRLFDYPEEDEYEEEEEFLSREGSSSDSTAVPEQSSRRNKVVNRTSSTNIGFGILDRYDCRKWIEYDARSIADHLNAKRTVVLNLEQTSKDISRRLIDFLSGVAYANNGQIQRVANSTYIITPYNVDIMGDLLDELENSGVFF